VHWAKDRTRSLGGTELPPTGAYPGDLGAHKYIKIYDGSAVEIDDSNLEDLINNMEPGAVLVWDGGIKGAESSGHIAVVEAVQEDGVWISQANWDPSVKFIPKEDLTGLYMIPPNAKPITPAEYRQRFVSEKST